MLSKFRITPGAALLRNSPAQGTPSTRVRLAGKFLGTLGARVSRLCGLLRNTRKTGRVRAAALESSFTVWRRGTAPFALLILLAGATAVQPQQTKEVAGNWSTYGSDKAFTRYSPLDQINAANAKELGVAWTRPAIDPLIKDKFPDLSPSNYFRGTPIFRNGKLYAPDGVGLLEAFDAATGKTVWVQQPVEPTMKEAAGQSTRGASYWTDGKIERVFVVRGEYLYSLDLKSGERDRAFGEAGRISLNRHTKDEASYFGWPGPFVVNDVVVIGGNGGGKASGGYGDGGFDGHAEPEDIRGFDVHSGKLLWTFHILPRKGEPGYDTWGKGSAEYSGNMAAWASLTADEQLGYVYVPLSAPTASHYGGHRPGKNLYSDSLLCLNVKNGKLVWSFQTIHHDLWEYDSATPPVLGDITVSGKRIKAVIAANKNGFLYVFDRTNGKPVWPIEERPVPKSTIPGEEPWPTQPFPTKPPAFDRQGFSEDDLIDFTPELHKKALEITSHYIMGPLYTPPSIRDESPNGKLGTLVIPGGWGAGNWNTSAFDPETGWYYAVSMTQAGSFGLLPNPDPEGPVKFGFPDGPPRGAGGQGGAAEELPPGVPFVVRGALNIDGLPIIKPPYGRVTAYDMNKGDKMWTAANGDGPRNHPLIKDLHLPPMGNTGRPAPMLTKTLLFLADSSDAVMGQAGITGNAKLRAFDKKTGQVVAEIDLPVGATGAPMTYMAEGKQYIVVPVGGRGYGAGWIGFTLAGNLSTAASAKLPATPAANGRALGGPFAAAQISHGEAVYSQRCAACHGAALDGGQEAPPLKGSGFWASWDQQTARALYSRILSSMPPDSPGSLAERDVIDLVAHIIYSNSHSNSAPSGGRSVEAAAELNAIKLQRPK